MVTKLVIAGHGKNKDGSNDPGAKGLIERGENRYYKELFFPAVKKYLPDNSGVILFSDYNVYSYGNLVELARKYGKDTVVFEMHYDALDGTSATGGHVIVHEDYDPDSYDLKMRDIIKKYIGVRYSHKGHAGISGRDDLKNCNIARNNGINYRLVELGFGTSPKDSKVMVEKVDAIAKDFVLMLCGKVKEPSKPVNKPTVKPTDLVHTVVKGDTLWNIANANGKTLAQLRKLNPGLKDLIKPGDKINLGELRVYTVKKNDTLSEIGARLGVKWTDIAKKNGINPPYHIYPNQKLKY